MTIIEGFPRPGPNVPYAYCIVIPRTPESRTVTTSITAPLSISAHANVGTCSRVCARKTLRSATHWCKEKFTGNGACRVTFKYLPPVPQNHEKQRKSKKYKQKAEAELCQALPSSDQVVASWGCFTLAKQVWILFLLQTSPSWDMGTGSCNVFVGSLVLLVTLV